MADSTLILYVEDDSTYILLVKRALQRSKLQPLPIIREVTTSEQAISYLSGHPPYNDRTINPLPTLVLTDLRLPGKSGLQLLRWIRQQPAFQALPVVMLTGSVLEADIEAAYAGGVNFCLIKPMQVEELVSIILALSVYWVLPALKR